MAIEFNLAIIIVFMLGLLTDHIFKKYSKKKRREEFLKYLLIDMNHIHQGFEEDVIDKIDMSIWEDVDERFFKVAKGHEEFYRFYNFYELCYEYNEKDNQNAVKERLMEIIEETFKSESYRSIIGDSR